MKKTTAVCIIAMLMIMGCVYQAPLTENHTIPVDPAVLGLWEQISDDNDPSPPESMLILRYSATEYLVEYPTAKDAMVYRCYPIRIGDVSAVQIQVIGTAEGDVAQEESRYHVVSYSMVNGELVIKTLNTDLVSKDLHDSAALSQAFLKNKGGGDLFRYPGRFKKVAKKS
jgi:hypothetical protein